MTVHMLVVDDETDVAELFKRRFRRELRRGDYVADFAFSGEEALAAIERQDLPELMLILSDINMPGMSGIELLRNVKERWPHLPVIMITAYGDEDRRQAALQLGAAEFLAKPIDFEGLKQHIARAAAPRDA